MAFSSTPVIPKSFKYDVFMSFSGEDVRSNFIDHLYYALNHKSIYTYKDDVRIKKGKNITDELNGSIEDSKFYIIVFSTNYASSSWCLDELVKIMECHNTKEHNAFPIFYDVEPSEVRKQKGKVKKAFASLKKEEAAGKWRKAMKEAADEAGWELKKTFDGHEAKFIQKIVEEISLELRSINYIIDEKLVGMKTRIQDVVSYLGTGCNDVRIIGIKGIGGGGKTTLARAVFDQISFQFEGKSFVENVREVSNASATGLNSLQNQIVSDVLNDKVINESNVFDGKAMMKRMMSSRKILVVLDDVDNIDQLEALAGEPNWFKPGSVIIITTRDEQVLVAHGVKLIRNVDMLSVKEATCLFSRYAFGKEIPIAGYEEYSGQVVSYADGLPLTIRVLGSFLCGKDDSEWIDALDRLKTIPLKETLKQLELSYIGLEEDYKEIFLDVACILKGQRKDLVIEALESCGFHAKNGLRVLEQKSLITFYHHSDDGECVGMHNHLEEMGKNIVRRSHPDMPNKHSRLWIDAEIENILVNNMGTEVTRCIQLYTWGLEPEIVMKGLRKMKELRFLDVSTGFLDEGTRISCFQWNWIFNTFSPYLPESLRYLRWNHYPFTSLPKTFEADNLVALSMSESGISQLLEGGERKVLKKLRFLDLNYSKLRTLNLGLIPNLEALFLGGCGDLVKLNMPIECQKLKYLDLYRSKLTTLDLRLTPNLEWLDIGRCYHLVELHMPHGGLKLKYLNFTKSKLRTLDLKMALNLERLNLDECADLVELHMPSRCLHLKSIKLTMSKLRTLDIGVTPNLEYLNLENCYDFEELHMANECQKLTSLNISHSKLRSLDLLLTPNLEKLDLKECHNLVELHAPIGCLQKLVYLDLSGCLRFKSFLFRIEDDTSCSVDESLEVDPLADLHLISKSLERCPFHPDNNSPKFQFTCLYKEDRPLLTRNLEKLISVGLCACTNLEMFSESICGLQRLRKLILKSYPEVPKDIDHLECLEELVLSSTKGRHLPDSICMLKHLKSLELLSCGRLEKLPKDLGQLECLQKLRLSSTKVKRLPDTICMLKQLKSLKIISCGRLQRLPKDLGQLECLEKLRLSSTRIKRLPDSICVLKQLKSLKIISCEHLDKLPEDLGQLECLQKLTLLDTKIKYFPDSVCMLKHLESLELKPSSLREKLPVEIGQLNVSDTNPNGNGVSM
ncbi:unnamed protein product [Lactuca saligna]|uniref:TIR domain-containing protein n=1 Tax=Lactuca saligna TaxID=75948 RepID=A0AA35YWM7_LACSI|nr:unnamed protein product [Lactuca saligna]